MSRRLEESVEQHLRPDESHLALGESVPESVAVDAAWRSGAGLAALPIRWLLARRRRKAGNDAIEIHGTVALTYLRLVAVGPSGEASSLDRRLVRSVEVFESKASPGQRRSVIGTGDVAWELHMSSKQTAALVEQLQVFSSVAVVENRGDGLALLKAIPVIFGYLFGGMLTLVAVPQADLPASAIGLGLLGGAEALRRALFRRRPRPGAFHRHRQPETRNEPLDNTRR